MNQSHAPKTKVVGIGLNKTGTKTLGHYLGRWGYRNRTYDSSSTTESPSFRLYEAGDMDALMRIVAEHDSFEDWPWPLVYKDIDRRFDNVKFVLTTRRSADVWYRSLCNMAVRIGPMPLYEKTVYGHALPHGHRDDFIARYEAHNAEVAAYFKDRPDDLLTLCWETGDDANTLAAFLGLGDVDTTPLHSNKSPRGVYDGDNPWLARLHRLHYRVIGAPDALPGRVLRGLQRRLKKG